MPVETEAAAAPTSHMSRSTSEAVTESASSPIRPSSPALISPPYADLALGTSSRPYRVFAVVTINIASTSIFLDSHSAVFAGAAIAVANRSATNPKSPLQRGTAGPFTVSKINGEPKGSQGVK